MIYIYLTFTMAGNAGGPSYMNAKTAWLKEKGWDVVGFDHAGPFDLKEPVILPQLLVFKDNRFPELFFPPGYYTKKQREKILQKLISIIGEGNEYVVESNTPRMALWGELLAERLGAKHLSLLIVEHPDLRSQMEFDFFKYKLDRNELFFIHEKICVQMFSAYYNLSEEQAKNYIFTAEMGVKMVDVPMKELESMPSADYFILSFGRWKPYFPNMIKGVVDFANKFKEKQICFIFMGDVNLSSQEKENISSAHNLCYKIIPSQQPVPRAVFDVSDIVIATAGCAFFSNSNGYTVIPMDVETLQPLGVLGYTTMDYLRSTDPNTSVPNLSELLENALVKQLYVGEKKPLDGKSNRGCDFQLSLVNDNRKYWPVVDKISMDRGFIRRIIQKLFLHCGGINILIRGFHLNN